MSGISGVEYTALFWETMEDHRGRSHYGLLRGRLDHLIFRKAADRSSMNRRDGVLRQLQTQNSTWHCSLNRNPDIVVFYQMLDDVIIVCSLGNHDDYYHMSGKQLDPLRRRIENAVNGPRLPRPNWRSLKWTQPSDLIGNIELSELDSKTLHSINVDLDNEADSGVMFKEAYGVELIDTDFDTFDAWLRDISEAKRCVTEAIVVADSARTAKDNVGGDQGEAGKSAGIVVDVSVLAHLKIPVFG